MDIFSVAQYYLSKLAKENQYIYHLKSSKFKDNYIYPLSDLKNNYPELYKKEIKKYEGRENQPNIKIDLLDTTWEEVTNFSTINPEKIFNLLELLNIPYQSSDIFKINIKDIDNEKFCIYTDFKS